MDRGGLFGDADVPEEPSGPGEEGSAPLRGWLPPEDRLWRHPSEVAGTGAPARRWATPGGAGIRGLTAPLRTRGRRVAVTVGAGVMVTAAAVLTFWLSDGSVSSDASRVPAATDTSVHLDPSNSVAAGNSVVDMVTAMRPSMVGLQAVGSSRGPVATGVVLPGGELVLTAASAVAGKRRVSVIAADGTRTTADVVGRDPRSGVAVIRTHGGYTPASFAANDVQPGELVIDACLCDAASIDAHSGARAEVAVGTVRSAGTTATLRGGPTLIDTIQAEMPLGRFAAGGVLLDEHGEVVGILDAIQAVDDDTLGVFVPSPLALGVANELATSRHVDQGWLGVVCTDSPTGAGVSVERVIPGGPAQQAGILRGDVVEAVDSHQVVTVADLRARLYMTPPGTLVQLSVQRADSDLTMSATVGDSPHG